MKSNFIIISLFCFFLNINTKANNNDFAHLLDSIYAQDTLVMLRLPEMYVFPQITFKNKEEERQYRKLVYDVKKTLPYAKLVYETLLETYEYMETLPNEKKKNEHLKRMEKDLYEEYMPVLKKMTKSQGKLLIKLIDRECNQSSYELIKAFLGSGRAFFWHGVGSIFGANIKSEYDPEGKDKLIEEVIQLVEAGLI